MPTNKKKYQQSEQARKAQEALQLQLSQKPGAYQSQWQQELDAALEKILNREPFSYDPGSDELYRQYREQYVSQGRLAMLDTLGQAQSMTGGYGNSYAQSAGQQTYQNYLQSLNSRIPELYQLALGRYQQEGGELQDRLQLLQGQEAADYGRYQDALSQWADQRDYLAQAWASQQDRDYSRWQDERDFAFRQEQAQQEQSRWQAEFDQALRQWEAAQAAAQAKSTGGKGGSYSGNGGVDAATVRKAQQFVGAQADGMWGQKSQAAASARGYGSLQEVIAAMGGTGSGSAASEIAQMVADGVSQYQINARIAKLTAQGQLTSAQAEALRKRYISPKYYY